ncbi:RNA-binding RNA annealing protein [Fusarium piperis]|uniref:RNA-binding RNA annealing protein n=1 Tax=Fusarium piperis TaxID=1435070 RepID=A0A9W8WCY9_9HYPO|nr:RNA-binding RNA annealing protein [Fusarium piperis]
MSGKLDQALEDITQAQRRSARRRNNPRRSTGRPAASAPVGGIQKNLKPARGAGAKPVPAKATPTNSDSKIIVSNLPKDVSEQQIKSIDSARWPGAIGRPFSFLDEKVPGIW